MVRKIVLISLCIPCADSSTRSAHSARDLPIPVISLGVTRNHITRDWPSNTENNVANLRVKFGHRLRTLRLRSELTQEQLAETANISVDFLSLIERGINAPSFESLERVAKALHLDVKDLFDFD